MGIINVTPDSFSDGGHFNSLDNALAQAEKLIADGADILDIGGESTRPYSDAVSVDEELRRVIPVIEKIRKHSAISISIDTKKAEVARQALQAGADIVNDIAALRMDEGMISVLRESTAPVILMHMQGTPADMQQNPVYDDVIREILEFFEERISYVTGHGIARERIILDPGIGFGKKLEHNLSIFKHFKKLKALDLPVLLGHSRKRFLGEVTGIENAIERDIPTAVTAALCAPYMDIVRVHNVAETKRALLLAEAILNAA
jgi:dihydropteroate synthase